MVPKVDACSLGAALATSGVIALAAIRQGDIVFANPAFDALFKSGGSLLGVALRDIVADADRERLVAALAAAEQAQASFVGAGKRGDGLPFDLELNMEHSQLGSDVVVLVFAADVTEQYRSRERLAYLAYSDPLTGLPNRTLFADRLHHAMLAARRYGNGFAVLMADLDGFKGINDNFGHDAGDVVLRQVAQRFQSCIRESDTLARLGGDEFAVMLPRLDNSQVAALVALRMIRALEDGIEVGAEKLFVGTSVGIASYPQHAASTDRLLVAADTALYRAKHAGKNQFQWATTGDAPELLMTAPMTWSAAHAVGIQALDDQHVHMAQLIDHLTAMVRDGAGGQDIVATLNRLIDYTAFHFASEEQLMTEHQLGDTGPHREAHRRLLDDIRNLPIASDLPSVSLMLRYLQEWLLRHIDGMDRELGRALVAKGCH